MRLRQLVKLKSKNLLVPFLTIGAISTLLGAELLDISPNPHSSTRPPSRASSMEGDQGSNTSAEASIFTEGVSRGTSTATTPSLGFSPPPEHVGVTRCPLGEGGVSEAQKHIKIFLYNGEGVMSDSVDIWQAAIGGLDVPFILESVTAEDIKSGKLRIGQCDLFVMPGGRASSFHEDLQDMGKQKIREFSRCGGKCLGVGAGAYFLSSQSQFSIPGGNNISREGVGLAKVHAFGPFLPAEKISFPQGESAFPVRYVQDPYKAQSYVFSNGGCFFTGHASGDIIAESFSGEVIVVNDGGNTVLSGVHPEFSAKLIPESLPVQKDTLTQTSRDLLRRILLSLSII